MQFGIAIPTAADSWRLVRRAEELGFSHAWFFDTQMLSADPFVAMAAAAMKTSRIKLGTGVLIPSNRIAPVAATAFASLNKLAPGRIVFGVSTGFTGRRTMGLGAVKLADMEEYIRVIQALWRGEVVEFAVEGKCRKIRLLNPELGLINIDDPMPTYIAASGPKARALTAKLGAAWIDNVADPERGSATLEQMRIAWRAAGHPNETLTSVAWIGGAVLEDGEPADGPRGMALAAPRAAMLLHRAADTALAGYPTPVAMRPEFAGAVEAYVEHARSFEPKDAYYLSNHRGHLMFVRPDERPFITADMIRRTSGPRH
jgi:5,10-methylenetetrahydromethanopterin reductase